jgi:hypothetical protein
LKCSRAWPWFCALLAAPVGCGDYGVTTSPPGGSAGSSDAGAPAASSGANGVSGAGGSSAAGGDAAAGQPPLGGASGAPADGCGAPDLDGIRVYASAGWDPLGYPPYALDGCNLVYVAPEQGGGVLRLRDLASGADTVLDEAASRPRRPAVSGSLIAWEAGDEAASQVRVHYQGVTRTLSGDFDHASEPRVCADAVVFTAFLGEAPSSDSDVYLYDVAGDELLPVASGPGQQRFADVSLTHVAWTDFSEDPAGYFDETLSISDVVVIHRESGEVVERKAPGKQAFPLLASNGMVVYLDWGAVHPEPKFSQFSLRAGRPGEPVELDLDLKGDVVRTEPAYVRPSLHGTDVDFIDTAATVVGLYRVSLTELTEPEATVVPGAAAQLLGPVATAALTLVSQQQQDQTRSLVVVKR